MFLFNIMPFLYNSQFLYNNRNQDNDYVLRVGEDLEVWIYLTVQNAGEDAHQATVFITLPESLRFIGTDEEVLALLINQFIYVLYFLFFYACSILKFA